MTTDDERRRSLEKIRDGLDELKDAETRKRLKNSSVFGNRSREPRSLRELPAAQLTSLQKIQLGLEELSEEGESENVPTTP